MERTYHYKGPTRGKGYQKAPWLSDKDEYIPNTHIGMYSLISNPPNESMYLPEDLLISVRRKSYEGLLEVYREYRSPDYADLWNYNIYAITETGLNYFTIIDGVKPIAHLIECFSLEQKVEECLNNIRTVISFGINRKLLSAYLEDAQVCKRTGQNPKTFDLSPLPYKSREAVLFGQDTIKIDDAGALVIDRNAIYNRFEHWCILQGISKEKGALMALEALLKQYPIDGLNNRKYYRVATKLDKHIFTPRESQGKERIEVELSKLISETAKAIIERYNADPANLTKERMNFGTYINNALHLLNSNMPLQYRDPELLADMKSTEKIESQNYGGD